MCLQNFQTASTKNALSWHIYHKDNFLRFLPDSIVTTCNVHWPSLVCCIHLLILKQTSLDQKLLHIVIYIQWT